MSKVRKTETPKPDANGSEAKASFTRTPIEVAAHQLRPSPWNPRSDITDESVADLAASIRELGLIQRIVVIRDQEKKPVNGTEFYMVVAGHRRLRAWCVSRRTGLIPCELLDCDVTAARRMTLIENLQRRDVDPLMEADLIAGLVADGMTEEEIAAETGRGNRWVWRRKRLQNLSEKWREKSKKAALTVDCLEKVARFEQDIQDKVLKSIDSWVWNRGGVISWGDIENRFNCVASNLNTANFKTDECCDCCYNTALQPLLFDVGDGKGQKKVGQCTNKACFIRKTNEAVAAKVAKLEHEGVKVREAKDSYSCGGYVTDKKTKTNTVPYVVSDYGGFKKIVWAESRKAKEVSPEEAAQRKAEKDEAKAYKGAKETVREWVKERMMPVLNEIVDQYGDEKQGWAAVYSIVLIAQAIGIEEYFTDEFKQLAGMVVRHTCMGVYKRKGGPDFIDDGYVIPVKRMIDRIGQYAADGDVKILTTYSLFRELIVEVMPPDEIAAIDKQIKSGFGRPFSPERVEKILREESGEA